MKSTICTFNADVEEAKNMLAENQPLVSLVTQLFKLKWIKKQPYSLAADIFYVMALAVMPKSLPEAISLGGGLVVGGLLASLGINNNIIISGIPNWSPIPSNSWYVVKKFSHPVV